MNTKPLPMPVYIQTQNFLLKSLTVNDVNDEFISWMKTDDMAFGLNVDTRGWTAEFFKTILPRQYDNIAHYMVGVFNLADKKLVGFFSFDVNYTHKIAYITTGMNANEVAPKVVFFETTDPLVNFFFEQRGVEKISARVLADNLRILFCFTDNKTFELEATLKKECVTLKGKRTDILIFSSFKEQFNERTRD